jgi:rhodanese-related sulfurtransferase
MELGWFQVENLFLSRNLYFSLIDLRKNPRLTGEEDIDRVLKTAVRISEDEIESHLKDLPKHHPVVLFCENGRRSSKAASRLGKLGYSQVYTLEGGEACFSSNTK